MKKRLLTTVFTVVLGSITMSVQADGLQVVRVDDDNTKVGANFDNGAGLDLFGLNVGLYGDSKKDCNCKAMQKQLQKGGSDKKMQQVRNKMQNCGCTQQSQGTPRQQRKAARRQSNYDN